LTLPDPQRQCVALATDGFELVRGEEAGFSVGFVASHWGATRDPGGRSMRVLSLAHVLVGEPGSTSPEHALTFRPAAGPQHLRGRRVDGVRLAAGGAAQADEQLLGRGRPDVLGDPALHVVTGDGTAKDQGWHPATLCGVAIPSL